MLDEIVKLNLITTYALRDEDEINLDDLEIILLSSESESQFAEKDYYGRQKSHFSQDLDVCVSFSFLHLPSFQFNIVDLIFYRCSTNSPTKLH
jgi:hypothetical protein